MSEQQREQNVSRCCWVTRRSDRKLLFLRRRRKGSATYLSPRRLRRRRKADYFRVFVLQNAENEAAVFPTGNALRSCVESTVVNSWATAGALELMMRLNRCSLSWRKNKKFSLRTCWRAVRGYFSWQKHLKRPLTETFRRIFNNRD